MRRNNLAASGVDRDAQMSQGGADDSCAGIMTTVNEVGPERLTVSTGIPGLLNVQTKVYEDDLRKGRRNLEAVRKGATDSIKGVRDWLFGKGGEGAKKFIASIQDLKLLDINGTLRSEVKYCNSREIAEHFAMNEVADYDKDTWCKAALKRVASFPTLTIGAHFSQEAEACRMLISRSGQGSMDWSAFDEYAHAMPDQHKAVFLAVWNNFLEVSNIVADMADKEITELSRRNSRQDLEVLDSYERLQRDVVATFNQDQESFDFGDKLGGLSPFYEWLQDREVLRLNIAQLNDLERCMCRVYDAFAHHFAGLIVNFLHQISGGNFDKRKLRVLFADKNERYAVLVLRAAVQSVSLEREHLAVILSSVSNVIATVCESGHARVYTDALAALADAGFLPQVDVMAMAQLTCDRTDTLSKWAIECVLRDMGAMEVTAAYQESGSVFKLARAVAEVSESAAKKYPTEWVHDIRDAIVSCIEGNRGKRFKGILYDRETVARVEVTGSKVKVDFMSQRAARRAMVKHPPNYLPLPDLREYDLITRDIIVDKLCERDVTDTLLIRDALCVEDRKILSEGRRAEEASWGRSLATAVILTYIEVGARYINKDFNCSLIEAITRKKPAKLQTLESDAAFSDGNNLGTLVVNSSLYIRTRCAVIGDRLRLKTKRGECEVTMPNEPGDYRRWTYGAVSAHRVDSNKDVNARFRNVMLEVD